MWEPENDFTEKEKEEIYQFMISMRGKKLYEGPESKKILDKILWDFIGVSIKKCWDYDFTLFNAYLDDNLTEDECDLRFYKRTDTDKYLNNGKKNPNFMKKYWKVI